MKPSFVSIDEWNSIPEKERPVILWTASNIFKNGFSQKDSYTLARRLVNLRKLLKLFDISLNDLESVWIKSNVRLNSNPVLNEDFYSQILNVIFECLKKNSDEIEKSNYDLRKIWSLLDWSLLERYERCFCCNDNLSFELLQKKNLFIHEECSNNFPELAKNLAFFISDIAKKIRLEESVNINNLDLEDEKEISYEINPEFEEIDNEPLQGKSFLDIF